MPYIGKQLVRGQNRELDDISGSFNGSNTVFNLTVGGDSITPGSALQLFISVGGVLQNPNTDFTVAGNQITFTTAPGSGLSFFGILQGDAVDFNTPADGSVTTAKLGSNLTINVADGTAVTPSIQFNGSGTDTGFYSPTTDEIGASVAGGEALRITSDIYVRLASGTGGIQFNGDTAAANALDDYEEGTWTPVLGDSDGTSTHTHDLQIGYYRKIGDTVIAWARVSLSALGSNGGGIAVVRGFPFPASTESSQVATGTVMTAAGFDDNYVPTNGYMRQGESQFSLNRYSDSFYRTGTIGVGRFTSTSDIFLQVTYLT